jgi:hypothetical protein
MSGSIDIRLNRHTKTYNENVCIINLKICVIYSVFSSSKDIIQGTVVISTPTSFKHNGITISVEGSVQLHLSGKSVGVFEAFYNSTKVNKVFLFLFTITVLFYSLLYLLIKQLN